MVFPTQTVAYSTGLPIMKQFTYLGSINRQDGGAKNDIKNRLCKAWKTIRSMIDIWTGSQYSISTKIKFYRSCVLSTLLYGSEGWSMTMRSTAKLLSFSGTRLWMIWQIIWPQKINNNDLLHQCNMNNMETLITKRSWRWIGHFFRMNSDTFKKVAL